LLLNEYNHLISDVSVFVRHKTAIQFF
jgi:hypothetical protein